MRGRYGVSVVILVSDSLSASLFLIPTGSADRSVQCLFGFTNRWSDSPFRELAARGTSTNQIAASWMLQATWLATVAVFPLTHNRCEVVISWWSPLLPKISIYATKCESILEKSGIFIHLQSKYCINLSCKKNLTISWVQIAARW